MYICMPLMCCLCTGMSFAYNQDFRSSQSLLVPAPYNFYNLATLTRTRLRMGRYATGLKSWNFPLSFSFSFQMLFRLEVMPYSYGYLVDYRGATNNEMMRVCCLHRAFSVHLCTVRVCARYNHVSSIELAYAYRRSISTVTAGYESTIARLTTG